MVSPPRVAGMVGTTAVSRSSRDYLSFFINRRWVSSRQLAWAVEEAYHGLLMTGKHPVAIIDISLPPQQMDVNIHPAKSEVKFQNGRLVFSTFQKAVRQALITLMPVPKIEVPATAYVAACGLWEALRTSAGGVDVRAGARRALGGGETAGGGGRTYTRLREGVTRPVEGMRSR